MNNIPICWPYLMPPPNMHNNKRCMQFGQTTKMNIATSDEVQNIKKVAFEENIDNDLLNREKEYQFTKEGFEDISENKTIQNTIEESESNLPEVFQSKPQISYRLKL